MTTKKTKAPSSTVPDTAQEPGSSARRSKPLVFISHDTRDADIAEAFANLLQDASGGVLRSFRSSDRKGTTGIDFGAEWYAAIMAKLNDATDVVALLTPQSLGRPWLLYEAGVAKGKLGTVVFGVALGVPLDKAGVGPFAQFQNSSDDEDSLTKLVLQLIRRNPEAEPREEAVRRQVKAFRDSSAHLLGNRPDATTAKPAEAAEIDANAVAKLFEEVKVMFRQLPEQLEFSLERRLRSVRSLPEANRDTIRDIYNQLLRATPGDRGIPWVTLMDISRDIPSLSGPLRKMRDAWRADDRVLIDDAKGLLLRRLPRVRSELLAGPESRWELEDLPVMLETYLRDLQTAPPSGDATTSEAIKKAGKGES